MKLVKIKSSAKEIERVIKEYISGELTDKEFIAAYPNCLEKFEQQIEDDLYHPLDIVVPTENNSEEAWKENMIQMYRQQIEELELSLQEEEESYSEMLGSGDRKELCKDALKAIKSQVKDITAKIWIEENLVDDVFFEFFMQNENSKFGEYRTLYSTPILKESFLLTALSNTLVKPPFTYSELLNVVRDSSDASDCFWAHCSEPDGALAAIEIRSSFDRGDAFDQLDQLLWIEHTSGGEVQWGNCFLILMPFNFEWMLRVSNDFNTLKIDIHGDGKFVQKVSEKLAI